MLNRLAPLAILLTLIPTAADAFCGFYVSGGGAKLFNNATEVVLLRDGTTTVLSMKNNYQGPPSDFAMVVPVPEVLQEENVKTLPHSVFDRVDRLGAPRLVEYWEQDPCYRPSRKKYARKSRSIGAADMAMAAPSANEGAVVVEAQFAVGEYEIVILSATDSSALDVWLRGNGYKIPAGAERVLRPYVAADMKFFVAKVDIEKVKYDRSGKTMLSPLRFHYDSSDFSLPIRLGLLNSKGAQDLIVNILANGQRYEVANYRNVFIPTNLRVRRKTKKDFATFYTSLFDWTLRRNPRAVVTEYSWPASSCDPCPGGAGGLSGSDLRLLGTDVAGSSSTVARKSKRRPSSGGRFGGWVLTRLHTRYTKKSLGDDLVFRTAPGVVGGRGSYTGRALPHGVTSASTNTFQGRYYILNRWRGAVACENPVYGRWGGPPSTLARGSSRPQIATDTAFIKKRRTNMRSHLAQSVPSLGFRYQKKVPKLKDKPRH